MSLQALKKKMKKRVNEKKEHFWFREFLDFPLYSFYLYHMFKCAL